MRTAREVYAQYKIMPSLQLHQLRVAAVAKLLCDNLEEPVNANDVILGCLFHDMGNIIKSDLNYFIEFTKPEGLEYWEKIKAEFISKYGENHHGAAGAIAREIGLPARSVEIINGVGYSKIAAIVASNDWEQKIAEYADTRVGPSGVLPLVERLHEGRERYIVTARSRAHYDNDEAFRKLTDTAAELEQQVCGRAGVKPEEINDTSIAPVVEQLWDYTIP